MDGHEHRRRGHELVTATEAHHRFGVPAGTVRSWKNRGELIARGLDSQGRTLYLLAELLARRERQRVALLDRSGVSAPGTGQTVATLQRSFPPPVCLPGGFVRLGGAMAKDQQLPENVVTIVVRPELDEDALASIVARIRTGVRDAFTSALAPDDGEAMQRPA